MKNIGKLTLIGILLFCMGSVYAQPTIYDANRWMGSDLNGTARFIGMGGAMGALGGDISTMGTNPAGIGIYRSNDAMLSFGFTNIGSKQSGGGPSVDKFRGSFDNAGFILSTKIGNYSSLRFVNFGFNYRRTKSFDKNMVMNGIFGSSQTETMAGMLNYNDKGQYAPFPVETLNRKDAYTNPDIPWLGLLGYDAHLAVPEYLENTENPEEGELFNGYLSYFNNGDKVRQAYTARERGGLHSYDFNVSFNFYDRFYLGATIGAYSIDYKRTSLYKEDFTDKQGNEQGGYDLGNDFWSDGSGVDLKLGFIWRPIESSSFRIGGAIHTPTFYSITESNRAFIDYDLNVEGVAPGFAEPVDRNSNPMDGEFKYRLVTPWKFNLSTGYTFGSVAAVGLEYEYMDYSSAKMKTPDGEELQQTDDVKTMMDGVHTLRAGVEFKLAPEFAFRLGYNHVTASMKSSAFKYLQDNSIRTDTEYSNAGATNNYTLGCGYRGEMFYVDMAYQYSQYKEDFYAFYNKYLEGTELKNNNHKVVLTVGLRF